MNLKKTSGFLKDILSNKYEQNMENIRKFQKILVSTFLESTERI